MVIRRSGLWPIFCAKCNGNPSVRGFKIGSQSLLHCSYAQAFICDAFAGERNGSEIHSAIVGSRLHQNHRDIHPYHPESAKKIAIALACKAIFLFRGLQPSGFGFVVAYEYFCNMENAQRILNIDYEYVNEEMREFSQRGNIRNR